MIMLTLLKGFTTCAGLIVAIGPQNAFVIRQGLLRNYLFITALLCSLIDGLLICLGVLGFGKIISTFPLFIDIAKYFAIVFLAVYGSLSFRSALKARTLTESDKQKSMSLKATVFLIIGLSFLNPHVYLDTVVLLGSIASQHPDSLRLYFAVGATIASFAWFFALTYGSRLLAPFLKQPKVWRWIDFTIAVMMWAIGITILCSI